MIKQKDIFKIEGDIIYINAAHRRTMLDPWVYFSTGTKKNVKNYMRLIRENTSRVLVSADLEFWKNEILKEKLTRKKEIRK